MTLQLLPSEFPNIWRSFIFFFISVQKQTCFLENYLCPFWFGEVVTWWWFIKSSLPTHLTPPCCTVECTVNSHPPADSFSWSFNNSLTSTLLPRDAFTAVPGTEFTKSRARILKLLRSPRIDSKEPIRRLCSLGVSRLPRYQIFLKPIGRDNGFLC